MTVFWLAFAIVTAVGQRHLFVVPPRTRQNRGAPLPALLRVRVGRAVLCAGCFPEASLCWLARFRAFATSRYCFVLTVVRVTFTFCLLRGGTSRALNVDVALQSYCCTAVYCKRKRCRRCWATATRHVGSGRTQALHRSPV